MVVPTMWIRNNMLHSGEQCQARQLTEPELKVQRSLQKLSVPDWYLNKRSNLPKIVNGAPIEFRPPSWKCSTPNSSILSGSDTHSTDASIKPAKKSSKPGNSSASPRRQKSPESKNRRSSLKSSQAKEEVFDTWIPEVSLPLNVSKTFPKVSPSRKIQNINLVLPPVPIDNISYNLDNEITSNNYSNQSCFSVEEQSIEENTKNDSIRNDETPCKKKNEVEEAKGTPGRLPYFFRIRATSTPKYSPANLFSSTLIEDSPKPKKVLSQNILEKSSIFEKNFSNKDSSETSVDHCRRSKKVSQNLLEKTFIFESSRADQSFQDYEDMSMSISRNSSLLDRNINPMESIFYGKEDSSLSMSKSSSMVREMVKKLEVSGDAQTPSKTSTYTWKKQAPVQTKKFNLELEPPKAIQEGRFDSDCRTPVRLLREQNYGPSTYSPCTRFLNSSKKSTELENVVRSKHLTRQKGVVQGIIEILAEKVNQSTLSRQKKTAQVNQNFVKMAVDALENVDRSSTISKNRRISVNEDTGSGSESEHKSYTSASVKDTDSDSDQRTPMLKSDDENKFDYSYHLETRNVHQEEDSVYWIPVSRCKLPRTSSLLSMMSRLSTNGSSPCVSPIRSDSEMEHQQAWGVTYKRTSSLSRKLFRIDETVVIDSGYSDKSDRSVASSRFSPEDSNWSEDTQNDSGSDCQSVKVKKSSKRRSMIASAFRF